MIRVEDLHESYAAATIEERIQMANLGAICWNSLKHELYDQWNKSQTADEGGKADMWRKEGGQAMMENLKTRLAAGDAAISRMSVSQASMDMEVARRVEEMQQTQAQLQEMRKNQELHSLELRLAEANGKLSNMGGMESGYAMLREAHAELKKYMNTLEEELQKHREASSTKTSYTLGKIGEAQLSDMLQQYVLPKFPYSDMKDMTAVKRSADFHVWLMSPDGVRVKLLLDAKKYKGPVPNIEIDKMYSDIDADDDAKGGIMISLDTAIYARSQFQITRTPRQKLCMFLTFEHIDDGIRCEVLCWALRVLVGIVSVQDSEKRDAMIEKIEWFIKELGHSVSDMEACVKACKTLSDTLRTAKDNLIDRMTNYRSVCGIDVLKEEISHTEIALSARCKGLKPNGERCKFKHTTDSEYCSRHAGGGQ